MWILTVHPKAIIFNTVSSKKKIVKTRFMNVNVSMSGSGASWNYHKIYTNFSLFEFFYQ